LSSSFVSGGIRNRSTKDGLDKYLEKWAERDFGKEHAAEIGNIVALYAKYNASPKPELVHPNTFSVVNYREAEKSCEAVAGFGRSAQRRLESCFRPTSRTPTTNWCCIPYWHPATP